MSEIKAALKIVEDNVFELFHENEKEYHASATTVLDDDLLKMDYVRMLKIWDDNRSVIILICCWSLC